MRDKKGIIFDVDGTLWDACGVMAEAWTKGLAEKWPEHAFTVVADQAYVACGKTMDEFARIMLPDVPEDLLLEMAEYLVEYEVEYMKTRPGKLYPGELEVLEELAVKYPLYIVSNCQVGYIENYLELCETKRFFLDHESYGGTGLRKHQNIMLLMDRNRLSSGVYVGDTSGDCDSAHSAQIPFIHCRFGFDKNVRGADAVIDSFAQLPGIVKQFM